MRVGLVTQAYYPVLGGVTEHVWHLGHQLKKRGHEVTVITGNVPRNHRQSPIEEHDRGLRVLRVGFQMPITANGANVSITLGWKLGRTLQRLEQQEGFDLLHIQSPIDPGLPLIATKTMRTPKVGTFHSYWDPNEPVERLVKWFRPIFEDALGKLAGRIAVSPSAEALIHRFKPDARMTIIPNGIDTKHFSPQVEPFERYQDDTFTILYVGRMDPRKGAKYLFSALPYLERELHGNFRLVVVGTGWMKRYYDAHIPLKLRHRVEFTGYASPEDLPRYYRSADVYCSPAIGGESFGIVLVEAMASGTAVVASDIDGYRWVITPGKEGILVPPKSPRHLAHALSTLGKDPKRREQMGRDGIETAQKYSWPSVTDQIEQVYQTVLDHNTEQA